MSRIIRPGARLVEEFVYHQEKLPTDRPIAQYIRRSTEGQVKKNIQSYIQQDEKFTRRLVTMGWQDTLEFIRKIEADQGISGQKREDERGGLHQLYHWIEHREIGAVGFYDASRLWRDPTHIWYNDFIQRLETYHIPVLTFSRIYWPNSQQDMDALREEFRQAAFYLRHIYEKVLPAKMQAIEDNASYGGGCVPMGYIVVGEKGERRYYVPYEPHARLIRYLFRRYRELGGNLGKLGRELRDTGFTFPPFEGVEKIPHVSLQWNGNGYALKTRQALISILTNPAYIGWYV